jgi:SAM-dependent MidA family methyltransferase
MAARSEPTPLALLLARQICSHGPLTFANYMETCLYHPLHGYYTKPEQPPRRDYFTSVDASPLFGRLLARQFHEMWHWLGRPEPFWLVEAGAGAGHLAKQVLDCAAGCWPDFYTALRFIAVERSASRRALQPENLEAHLQKTELISPQEGPVEIPCGCIFSNELIDAMPVHRVIGDGDALGEIYVGLGKNGLCDERGPLSSPALQEYFSSQRISLQAEQQAEVNLAACRWIAEAGEKLKRGFLVTIDYGHQASELYGQRHMRGTLLAYQSHRVTENVYGAPGEQDLTAHVNFSALDIYGQKSGLLRTGFTSQCNFLLALARHGDFADLQSDALSEVEQIQRRLLFKTLIHPEGMGETFQVLIQHKGVRLPRLAGLEPL